MSSRRWCWTVVADGVERAVSAFTDSDPAGRCAVLTPGLLAALEDRASAPCEAAIEDVPLGTGALRSVEVWGEEAQARLSDDTLFLTRDSDGWRIAAAGCRPRAEGQPYDCELEAA